MLALRFSIEDGGHQLPRPFAFYDNYQQQNLFVSSNKPSETGPSDGAASNNPSNRYLNEIIKRTGYTYNEISQLTQIPRDTLYRIHKCLIKSPRYSTFQKLFNFYYQTCCLNNQKKGEK